MSRQPQSQISTVSDQHCLRSPLSQKYKKTVCLSKNGLSQLPASHLTIYRYRRAVDGSLIYCTVTREKTPPHPHTLLAPTLTPPPAPPPTKFEETGRSLHHRSSLGAAQCSLWDHTSWKGQKTGEKLSKGDHIQKTLTMFQCPRRQELSPGQHDAAFKASTQSCLQRARSQCV